MERSTFTDHRVIEKSRQFVLLKSDLTRKSDPQVREVSRQFRIIGLPTVVFLDRKGREVSELRVEGFLDTDSFLHRMEKASK
jgi:thiol:disulfide interchange protein DsbD